MGCDIHLYCEVKKHVNGVEQWVNVDHWQVNPYFDPTSGSEKEYIHKPVYTDRNYSLFARLAGVRNSFLDRIEPIDKPRGMPDNVSVHTNKECERWDCDGHSHSWFTMRELVEAHKNSGTRKYSGMVSPEDAAEIDAGTGTPSTWCQGTTNKDWVLRSWTEEGTHMDNLMEKLIPFYKDEFWIWEDSSESFEKNLDKFRIVFWFDN